MLSRFWFLIGYILVFYAVVAAFRPAQNEFSIKILDVGEGDAIFISTPHGKHILIDGGPSYDADLILSAFSTFPFCPYDLGILTHQHADHANGFLRIEKRCDTRINDISGPNLATAKSLETNGEINVDGVFIKLLWPNNISENADLINANINNSSKVLYVKYDNFEALLLSDAENEVLARVDAEPFIRSLPKHVDLFKVSHHGSYNGMYYPLYSRLRPLNCAISVGTPNKFGHPSSDVIISLTNMGCKILRTDVLGTISFKVKND